MEQGEIFGFLGPNGSGKTTAVKIFATLLRQTAGAARVGGFDTSSQPARVRQLVGYVCTFITTQARFCDVSFTLSTGLLSFQGIACEPNQNEPFTVTRGTGNYAAGRGSAWVNDVNDTTVRFTVKLPA